MRALGLSLTLACAISLTGCPSPSGGGVPLDQLGGELANATCDYADRCSSSLLAQALGGADCRTTYTAFVDEQFLAQIRAAVAAGTVVYHGDSARACLDIFPTLSCETTSFTDSSACTDLFEGRIADGHACDIEQECGPTSTCTINTTGTCPRGMCQHIAQLGEACDTTAGMGCDSNMRCAAGVCARYAMSGESCTATGNECAPGLRCSATTGAGTCGVAPTAQAGESCSGTCATGLVCASTGTDFVCSAARSDGSCRESLGSPSDCIGDEVCIGATFTSDGTCGARVGEGQPCSGNVCASGLHCATPAGATASACVRYHHLGESCADDSGCYSNNCDGGTCAGAPLCMAN